MRNFANYQVDIRHRTSGVIKTICNQCLPTRHNKRDRSLRVNIDTGHCHCYHCGADFYVPDDTEEREKAERQAARKRRAAAVVHFLLAHKGYPQALMANEVQVQLNGTKKRCDTVLYRRDLTARMIVEYKAPEIEITQKVFDQITRYNMVLKVDYLIVSNGLQHYCCRIDYEHNSYTFLQDIPEYQNL